MSFLAPVMLLGSLAMGVPIALHLLGRSRPRLLAFPSLRFILHSHRQSTRVFRFKNILLLALRIALPVVFAVILARPYLRSLTVLAGENRIRVNAVLILDTSYSMAYREGSRSHVDATRFALARAFAVRLLDHLTPDSRVGLILLSDRAERVVPRLTIDHAAVRQRLRAARLTWRATRYSRALAAAYEMLAEEKPAPNKAVFLISDLTQSDFHASPRADPTVRLVLVDIKRSVSHNGAVLGAELSTRPIAPGAPLTVTAEVLSPYPDRDVLVSLRIDGRKIAQQMVSSVGRAASRVHFTFPAPSAGRHAGEVRLEEWDPLGEDNAYPFVFEVSRRVRVLVVGPPLPRANYRLPLSSAELLHAALAPEGLLWGGIVEVTAREAPALSQTVLSGFDAILLAGSGALAPSDWTRIESFVDAGGGLIVVPSGPADAEILARHDYAPFAREFGLLPGRIQTDASAAAVGIDLADPSGPILRAFRGGRNGELGEARLKRCLRIDPEPKDLRSTVLVRLTDGEVLLMEKRFGRGRVLASAAGFDLASGTLPRLPCFVPWVHQLIRHVVPPRSAGEPLAVGQVLEIPLSAPARDGVFWLRRPDSQDWERRKTSPGHGSAAAAAPIVLVGALDRPGIYRVRYALEGTPQPVESLHAAVLDTAESRLEPVAENRLRQLLASPSLQVVRELTDLLLSSSRTAQAEIAGWLWPVLILILVAECHLANRMYRT